MIGARGLIKRTKLLFFLNGSLVDAVFWQLGAARAKRNFRYAISCRMRARSALARGATKVTEGPAQIAIYALLAGHAQVHEQPNLVTSFLNKPTHYINIYIYSF